MSRARWSSSSPTNRRRTIRRFFAGKALTYYGRWTYKYEEATRRGAKAVLIIHTNETAGYPYSVVEQLSAGPDPADTATPLPWRWPAGCRARAARSYWPWRADRR